MTSSPVQVHGKSPTTMQAQIQNLIAAEGFAVNPGRCMSTAASLWQFHGSPVAHPKAMRSTLSHNFSINPTPTDAPTPGTFIEDYSRSVMPTLVYSHNDDRRPRPLYSALAAG
ncbi:hypothetical protein E4U54_001783 [Claviceps lovelessii]|nr:hypothetical protein E4U54_001783 [Claviceps lovelessii]